MLLQVKLHSKSHSRNGAKVPVLSNLKFVVEPQAITALYGPSGCGKTTLMRIVAGLDTEYDGEVLLHDRPVTGPTRKIGLTVQLGASFDWLSVADNIVFGLRYADRQRTCFERITGRVEKSWLRSEALRLAAAVGLAERDLAKYPTEISGGMRQRMAFARALLPQPDVLLLDEPFSSLDYDARRSLQDLVLSVRDRFGTACVLVSHDPEEVLYLADKVVVLGGAPATVTREFIPDLPARGTPECVYSNAFQDARRELRGD